MNEQCTCNRELFREDIDCIMTRCREANMWVITNADCEGGTHYAYLVGIKYCPWCGKLLPELLTESEDDNEH